MQCRNLTVGFPPFASIARHAWLPRPVLRRYPLFLEYPALIRDPQPTLSGLSRTPLGHRITLRPPSGLKNGEIAHRPKFSRKTPDVGYMRALSPEGLLALDPDLILVSEGPGPAEIVQIRMSAIGACFQPDQENPVAHDPGVLACR